MPPIVVLVASLGASYWCIRQDAQVRQLRSRAAFIPLIWLGIIASRPLSYWTGSFNDSLEGNPINTYVFAVLIASSIVILNKRRVPWGVLVQQNKALFCIYLFFAISMVWSQFPLVSEKRLLKDFGCVLSGLVLLTETNPLEKIRMVFVRIAYVFFPLSVVLGKYFPNIGRAYSLGGEPMFTGVTTNKNLLGQVVFVFSVVLLWDLIELAKRTGVPARKKQAFIRWGTLAIGLWLLLICDSRTSLFCLIVAASLMWGSGRLVKFKGGRQLLLSGIVLVALVALLDQTLGASDMIIKSLGRNQTLTGRTEIWHTILSQGTNPIIGEGFYIFWDTVMGYNVVSSLAQINSAHNGYLETFVDGGAIGEGLLIILLAALGWRAINRLFSGDTAGRVALVYWTTAIFYNVSESSFFRLDPLWFSLLLMTTSVPVLYRGQSSVEARVRTTPATVPSARRLTSAWS